MSFWTSKGQSESWLQRGHHSNPGTRPTIIISYFQYFKTFEPEPFNMPCGHCAHAVSYLRCQKFKHLCFPWSPWLCSDLQIGHRKLIQWSWLYLQGTISCMQVSIPWSTYWFVRGWCAFAPKAYYVIVVRLFFLSWISIHSLDSSD